MRALPSGRHTQGVAVLSHGIVTSFEPRGGGMTGPQMLFVQLVHLALLAICAFLARRVAALPLRGLVNAAGASAFDPKGTPLPEGGPTEVDSRCQAFLEPRFSAPSHVRRLSARWSRPHAFRVPWSCKSIPRARTARPRRNTNQPQCPASSLPGCEHLQSHPNA